jgi:hypothetical protein
MTRYSIPRPLRSAAIVTVLALSGAVFALSSPASASTAQGPAWYPPGGGPVLVQTDSPSGNQVSAYQAKPQRVAVSSRDL